MYVGPVIDGEAVDRFEDGREAGPQGGPGRLAGGEVLRGRDGLPEGNYLAPTVVADLPADDRLLRDELFVPLVAVAPVGLAGRRR